MINFRTRLTQFVPRWLKQTVMYRLIWTIGVHIDVAGDYIIAALRKRFLEPDSFDALSLHGAMRKIPRGPYEPDETYAARLPNWFDVHKRRGNPYALLEQLFLYFQPAPFPIDLVYPSGLRFSLAADGTITWGFDGPTDINPAQWARWTLIFHWPNAFPPNPAWDGGIWDDGGVWDSELPGTDAAAIRVVPEAWNAAHAIGTIIVLAPGAEAWDYPFGIWDDGGTWDSASAFGVAPIYFL